MTLKFISIGLTRVPKGTFQVRIENPFPSRIRLKHYKTPQDFAATDTAKPDRGDLAGESLNVQVDRPTYVHGTVANVNGFFREIAKLGQELVAHENRVVRLPAKFRGSARDLDVCTITVFTAPRIAWKCAGGARGPGEHHPAIYPASQRQADGLLSKEIFRKDPCPGFFQLLVKVRFA